MNQKPQSVFAKMRSCLIRGALFLLPIWLCAFVIGIVYSLCEAWLGGLTSALVRLVVPSDWLTGMFANGHIPGLSLVTAFLLLYALGAIASWQIGRQGLRLVDWLFLAIPGVKTVYSAARKVIDAIGEPGKSRFQKVVLVEFVPGIKTLGFVTNETLAPGGEKYYVIFIPHMPNPTGGFVVVMPAAKVVETDMRPDEGLKMGVSLGVLLPPGLPLDKLGSGDQPAAK